MIDLTREAQTKLDDYMGRIGRALRGRSERSEVEQNVREHIEAALSGAPTPVGTGELTTVLTHLGPPEQWIPEDERPVWKRVADRLISGPEDWRLAYLSFATTLLMFIFFPVGGILLLIPAFMLSRAHVALVTERGESLGARRWLVLPPIVFVTIFLAGTALIAPIAGLGAWGVGEHGFVDAMHVHPNDVPKNVGLVLMGGGVWWIILSGLIALLLQPIRNLLAPVANSLKRSHMVWLAIAGVVALAAGAFLVY